MKKLLIANRGEIAVRIQRTCKRLGIKTVAVFSRFDEAAFHRDLADEAYLLSGETPTETYLNIEQLVSIALRSGADSVHPGYGFLSESAEFSEAVEKAGLRFVGPSPLALLLAGNKDQARKLAASLKIPTPKGYDEQEQSFAALLRAAKRIGVPLLVKAVAGGGGRGMRLVKEENELEAALKGAAEEAKKFFADPRLILEQFISPVRHIEVQLVGNGDGDVWHLYERDCSLQRRYQKLIEECPARSLLPTVRSSLFSAALELGKAIKLKGVATAEFLVRQDQTHGEPYYFLEINPRIQVEHPVTELITGLDIVELQLQIARGDNVKLRQDEIQARGYAIEARVCAELPALGFRPSTGVIEQLTLPSNVRVDHALKNQLQISSHYDSLILKVISSGATAEEARERLSRALQETTLSGIDTNIWFLRKILDSGLYGGANVPDTTFLDAHVSEYSVPAPEISQSYAERALAGHLGAMFLSPATTFRTLKLPALSFVVSCAALGKSWNFSVLLTELKGREDEHGSQLNFTLDGKHHEVFYDHLHHRYHLHQSGSSFCSSMKGPDAWMAISHQEVEHFQFQVSRALSWKARANAASERDTLTAPLPGTVLAIRVRPGDTVKKGDVLLTIESMKMEHTIRATRDGIIKEVRTTTGARVGQHELLIVLE